MLRHKKEAKCIGAAFTGFFSQFNVANIDSSPEIPITNTWDSIIPEDQLIIIKKGIEDEKTRHDLLPLQEALLRSAKGRERRKTMDNNQVKSRKITNFLLHLTIIQQWIDLLLR